jgi:hypothetical protein
VNLVLAPLVRSTIHRSALSGCRGSFWTTTALLPSGDTFIVPYGARSPGRPTMSPWRLNHVSWRLFPVTDRYTSVPFFETEKWPSAALGNAGHLLHHRDRASGQCERGHVERLREQRIVSQEEHERRATGARLRHRDAEVGGDHG